MAKTTGGRREATGPRVVPASWLDRDLRLARERVGKLPREKRLRWVVDFVRTDLEQATSNERRDFGYGLRALWWWNDDASPATEWLVVERESGPMPDDMLVALHRDLGAGLRGLTKPLTPWPRAQLTQEGLVRATPTTQRRAAFQWRGRGTEPQIIIRVVQELVIAAGQRLGACPECSEPFVAIRRQEYCTDRCAQRVRDRRRDSKTGSRRQSMRGT